MPEESSAPEQKEETNQAAQQPTTPNQAAKPKKSNNGCVIAIIVVAALVVIVAAGIFIAYRYIRNKVDETVKVDDNSTSINVGDTHGSVSTSGDSFQEATDQNPSVALIKTANDDLKPIFSAVFGGAKTTSWTSLDSDSGTLGYTVKNAVTADNFSAVSDKMVEKGYTSTSDYTSSDGAMMSFDKDGYATIIYLSATDSADQITVTISKIQDTNSNNE